MFKPCEVYASKKASQVTEEVEKVDENELKNKYFQLNDKKMLKFIRKAEKKYDSYVEEHVDEILPPFGEYLSKREMALLLKAYGMPEKPAVNSRQALITKLKNEAIEANKVEEKKAFQYATELYNQLSNEEKNNFLDEYHHMLNEYNEEFFNFARSLPAQRVIDYRSFVINKKSTTEESEPTPKPKIVKTDLAKTNSVKTEAQNHQQTKQQTQQSVQVPKKDKKEAQRIFQPGYQFYKKNPQESSTEFKDLSKMQYFNKMRTKFTTLPDKKKVKFIKDAEAAFDSFDFSEIGETKPLFFSFLNKKEQQIYLESYGLPSSLPNNVSGLYFQKQMKEGKLHGMKEIFDNYKLLSAEEKKDLVEEHKKLAEEHKAQLTKFLSQIPAKRMEDYNLFKMTKTQKKDTAAKSDVKSNDKVFDGIKDIIDISENTSTENEEEEVEEESLIEKKPVVESKKSEKKRKNDEAEAPPTKQNSKKKSK